MLSRSASRALALLLAVGLTTGLAACDGTDALPNAGRTASYALAYVVDGTYAGCTVRYRAADYQTRAVEVKASAPGTLAWRHETTLRVSEIGSGFTASVSATCADSARTGKVTASVLVDNQVRATQTTATYGATARAETTISVGSTMATR